MSTAIVVGAGPNGLAAAVALAKAGVQVTVLEAADEIGGGTRTSEAIVPGLLHDHCSAIHPMAVGSPFLAGLGLERYGLSWRLPEIDCVHPLDGGSAGVLYRSVEATADGLGADGARWRRLFGRTSANFDALSDDIMGPLLRVPHHPLTLARFGAPTVLPASTLARWFRTPEARALFGGVAAHAFRPLHYPMTSAIGLGILTAGHRHGWPVAAGGSQSITNALAALLADLGGKIETGTRIETASQLPPADVTMFDLAPEAVAGILGDRAAVAGLPAPTGGSGADPAHSRWTSRSRVACRGPIPTAPARRHRARRRQLRRARRHRARYPRRTHAGAAVRAGRPAVPGRPTAIGRQHPPAVDLRACAERVSPAMPPRRSSPRSSGSPRASATASSGWPSAPPTQMAAYNPNFVGGDIMTGSKDIRQLAFGPRITLSPYKIGVPGMYICSAATPPGPGAHGMCGANAADVALKDFG